MDTDRFIIYREAEYLNMLLRAYNLITKRVTRSLYMMLERPNKDNKYLVFSTSCISFW